MRSKLLTCRAVSCLILLVAAVILAPEKQVFASSTHEIIKVSDKSTRGDLMQARHGRAGSVIRGEKGPRYRDGEVLVKFKPSVAGSAKAAKHLRLQATLIRDHKALRLQRVALKKGMPVDEAIAQYKRDPDVEYAEPNYLVTLLNTPNDSKYDQLWGLAKIKAPQAWDITTGDSNAVIAILDTGIDYTHPDLIGNLWTNPGEVNGQPGLDNDGNGYPNDLHGYNAIDNNGDPKDSHYHGTHVAGTIGAVGNNATGVTGVAWNAKLMACKFIGANGSGYIGDAIECLQYVKAMKASGVNVVATNNSWGSTGYSQALYDAIRDQKDILFVAAAGNDNSSEAFYPAGYDLPNIISTAATDEYDSRASFSNYGRWSVDLAAPGNDILSTFLGGSYTYLSGTSMAAPHVSGLAALLKSQNASRTAPELKNLILSGGDNVASLSDLTVTGKRINAYNSLTCTNSQLFSPLHIPTEPQPGLPVTVSAISINCAAPVGPVSVTLSGGSSIELRDDGVAPDETAGDGIFTGTWTPMGAAVETLTFTSPLGTKVISSPPVAIGSQPSIMPGALLLPNSVTSASTGVPFSLAFPIAGGIPPYSWSLASFLALPDGLTLNSQTGEIAGTATSGGVVPITMQVEDSLGMKDRKDWTLLVNEGVGAGWPKELRARVGSGILSPSSSPIVADLDGDGKDEIIVADVDTLYVFYPDGSTRKTVLPGHLTTPAVADLDGDGKKEVIVSAGYYYSDRNSIYAFHWDLSPVTGFPAGAYDTVNGGPGQVSSPVVADFNNDGQLEIAVVATPNNIYDPNFGTSYLILVDSHGQMLPGWPQVTGPSNLEDYTPPAVADLFGDGGKELVSAGRDGYLRVWRADGTLAGQWQYGSGVMDAWNPVIADLDGDGHPDIIVKSSESTSANIISAFDRFGNPLTGWPQMLPGGAPVGPIVADLDGDGRLEVIVVGGDSNELHVLKGNGSYLPGWPISFFERVNFDCLPVIGDIDGDGRQEVLVTAMEAANNGKLLAFTADGSAVTGFPKYTSPATELRSAAAIGDLDGNGKLDLVIKSEDGYLWRWEMPGQAPIKNLQWPMFRNDPQHTGALVPSSRLQVSPASFKFNDVAIGSASSAQIFTVSNPLTAPVPVSSIATAGPDAAMFSITGGTCASAPFPLAAGKSCTVKITFVPTAEGSRAASLAVASSAIGSSVQAQLTGTGVPRPTARIYGTPASRTNATGATLMVGGTGVISYIFKLDNDGYSFERTVSTLITLSVLSETSHTISVLGKDAAGNWQVTPTVVSWTVDLTPPVAIISGTPANPTSATGATLTISGTDVVSYKYKLDSDSYYSAETAVWTPIMLSWLNEASHTVSVLGKDTAGNWQVTPTVVNWTVDLTPPTAVVTGGPPAQTNATTASLNVGGSGVVSYKYRVHPNLTYSSELPTATAITLAALSEGSQTVYVLGKDAAGNWQVTPTVVSWTVDLTPPTAGISGVPAALTNASGATLTISGTGVVAYKYKLDSGSYSAETAVATSLTLSSLSEATHTVSVLGKDAAGNWQITPTVVSWTVDLTPPAAVISGTPANPTNTTGATLTVSATDVVSYKYKLDNGSYSTETAVATPITISSLSEATHTVSVVGKDAAGNWQVTPTVASWTVDLTPPTAGISGAPAALTNATGATLAISGAGVASYKYKLDSGSYSAETAVATSITLSSLSEATHTISVLGKDAAGNWQVTPTVASWTVDLTPPAAVISGTPASPTNATGATLIISGAEVVSYKYKLDSGSYSAETAVATPLTPSSLSEAAHTVSVLGKDAAGNWQVTPTVVSWTVDRTPPTAVIAGAPAVSAKSTSATLTVGGAGVISYKYKLDTGSYSAETAVAMPITLTSLGGGTHTVSALGKDAAGNWQVTPTAVSWIVDLDITAIAAGSYHTLALFADGTVWAWGSNFYGELGNGWWHNSYPAQVKGLSGVTAIAAGDTSSFALKADGTVWAWGGNSHGQLGDGTTSDRNTPVQVTGMSGVISIKGGIGYTIAVKGDGTVWVWGWNQYGQLGNGTTTDCTSAVQLTALSGVTAVAAGSYHSLARKSDGTIWAWGYNGYGEIGTGTPGSSRLSPVLVPGLSDVIALAAGTYHSTVLKGDGTVWNWGANYYGQLGDGGPSSHSTPFQVPGLAGVTSISAGYHFTVALKQDGTVWGWGSNDNGQLGSGAISNSIPVQAALLSGVTSVAAGGSHTMALRGDNTLWGWGWNTYGNVGDGTTVTKLTRSLVNGLGTPITPLASIAGTPATLTTQTSTTLTVGGSGVVSYRYQLDEADYSAEAPVGTPITLSSLADGTHIVAVIGKDNIGNWQSTPTTTAWNVDSTPPAATITGTPSSPTKAASATLTVGGTGVTYYRYKLDDGAYSADTYVYTNITLSNLSEGTHNVAVIGKDAAGNWQATPTEVSWKVDTSAPATTASPTGYIVVSGKVSLACSDGAGSGCVTTRYCLGTGCTPATTYRGPIPINANTDLRFYSTDAAGNSESVKTASYTVLASDYTVAVTVSGSGTGSVTSNPAAISATGSASARFPATSTVTLQATPGPYSAFTGWTGACTGVGDCVLSVTADRAATATFAIDTFHSTNTGAGVYNSTIQAALNGSLDNDIIHLWGIGFFENLIFSQDKKATISGGYDQQYTAQSGSTILNGALRITNGTVKIDRLTLR